MQVEPYRYTTDYSACSIGSKYSDASNEEAMRSNSKTNKRCMRNKYDEDEGRRRGPDRVAGR
jgi:hypothetical protein